MPPSKQNMRAACPKDKLEFKLFFFEPYITDRFEAHVVVKLSFSIDASIQVYFWHLSGMDKSFGAKDAKLHDDI